MGTMIKVLALNMPNAREILLDECKKSLELMLANQKLDRLEDSASNKKKNTVDVSFL